MANDGSWPESGRIAARKASIQSEYLRLVQAANDGDQPHPVERSDEPDVGW